MLRVVLTTILLGLGTMLIGCQTMGETPQQQKQRYYRMAELNRMMINEDLQSFWLLDRPSHLTRWRVPVETIK